MLKMKLAIVALLAIASIGSAQSFEQASRSPAAWFGPAFAKGCNIGSPSISCQAEAAIALAEAQRTRTAKIIVETRPAVRPDQANQVGCTCQAGTCTGQNCAVGCSVTPCVTPSNGVPIVSGATYPSGTVYNGGKAYPPGTDLKDESVTVSVQQPPVVQSVPFVGGGQISAPYTFGVVGGNSCLNGNCPRR